MLSVVQVSWARSHCFFHSSGRLHCRCRSATRPSWSKIGICSFSTEALSGHMMGGFCYPCIMKLVRIRTLQSSQSRALGNGFLGWVAVEEERTISWALAAQRLTLASKPLFSSGGCAGDCDVSGVAVSLEDRGEDAPLFLLEAPVHTFPWCFQGCIQHLTVR